MIWHCLFFYLTFCCHSVSPLLKSNRITAFSILWTQNTLGSFHMLFLLTQAAAIIHTLHPHWHYLMASYYPSDFLLKVTSSESFYHLIGVSARDLFSLHSIIKTCNIFCLVVCSPSFNLWFPLEYKLCESRGWGYHFHHYSSKDVLNKHMAINKCLNIYYSKTHFL